MDKRFDNVKNGKKRARLGPKIGRRVPDQLFFVLYRFSCGLLCTPFSNNGKDACQIIHFKQAKLIPFIIVQYKIRQEIDYSLIRAMKFYTEKVNSTPVASCGETHLCIYDTGY